MRSEKVRLQRNNASQTETGTNRNVAAHHRPRSRCTSGVAAAGKAAAHPLL